MKIKLYVIAFVLGLIGMQSCDNKDDIPVSKISATIQSFITEKYPDARIIEADIEKGMTDVDIMDNNIKKEVLFDSSDTWVSTSWDIAPAILPTAITDSLKKSIYNNHVVDDADYFETPAGDYYFLELEEKVKEVYIKMDLTGKIL